MVFVTLTFTRSEFGESRFTRWVERVGCLREAGGVTNSLLSLELQVEV